MGDGVTLCWGSSFVLALVIKSWKKVLMDGRDTTVGMARDVGESSSEKGSDVLELPARPKLKRPSLYKVVLLNDDYTPMEFVIDVLQEFFSMNREKATQIMLAVHTTGKGTCGIFSRDVAETKSAQVNQYAQDNEHPLVSIIEAVD